MKTILFIDGENFKSKIAEVVYVGFENRPNKGLTYTTNRTILIRDAEVEEFKYV